MPARNGLPEQAHAADERKELGADVSADTEGSETPEQREMRAAELQKEISSGTYEVDTRKLAAKIVDAHLKRER